MAITRTSEERLALAVEAEASTKIRVWWRGPVEITDESGTRIEGEFEDLPASHPCSHEILADGSLRREYAFPTIEQERGRRPWIFRGPGGQNGGMYHPGYIESERETARRVIADLIAAVHEAETLAAAERGYRIAYVADAAARQGRGDLTREDAWERVKIAQQNLLKAGGKL